jgi:vacuolar-type H+-ATPase subunit H
VAKDFAPIVKLAEKINYDKLKQPLTVNDVNLTFKIKDGVVNVDPFVVKLDGIPCKIHGYTTLDQVIDYNVDMDIPMDRFPSNIVNQAGSFIGDLNKKLGSNLSIGKSVNVIARITGTVKDPKVGVTSKALGEDAVQSLKDQAVTAIKQEVVQQATALKNDALEKAKAEKERLVAEAKVQAEKAKQQARVLAQQGKDEAYKLAKQTEDSAKNPLEKMAKKVAADKIRKEADDKYNKAIAKADQEADKLVVDASARGDKMISDANAAGDQTIKKVN